MPATATSKHCNIHCSARLFAIARGDKESFVRTCTGRKDTMCAWEWTCHLSGFLLNGYNLVSLFVWQHNSIFECAHSTYHQIYVCRFFFFFCFTDSMVYSLSTGTTKAMCISFYSCYLMNRIFLRRFWRQSLRSWKWLRLHLSDCLVEKIQQSAPQRCCEPEGILGSIYLNVLRWSSEASVFTAESGFELFEIY